MDIAIGEGIGFVADGTAGLQVVNYLPFDTNGVPPTASISLPASAVVGTGTDGNPEVVEASTVNIQAAVASDVQVRNVELLVNGQVVQNDVSFPFDLLATLPTIAQDGSTPVTIQVEAIDTGGNVGMSNTLTVDLVKDTTPPTILETNAPNGSIRGQNFRAITFDFSKPLNPSTVTASTFQLIGPSGVVTPLNIQFRRNNASIQLTYPTLVAGSYQLVIDAAAITDVPGNRLGSTPIHQQLPDLPLHGSLDQPERWFLGQPHPTGTVALCPAPTTRCSSTSRATSPLPTVPATHDPKLDLEQSISAFGWDIGCDPKSSSRQHLRPRGWHAARCRCACWG